MRQRLRLGVPRAAFVAPALAASIGLVLAWYGLMLILLAAGVDPGSIDRLSGYRTAYDLATGLGTGDTDGLTRLWIALGGVAAFLLLGYLALRELPRPRLARRSIDLADQPGQRLRVEARARERLIESALAGSPHLADSSVRVDGERIVVSVVAIATAPVATALADAQLRARRALEQHGLPVVPVDVTLQALAANRKVA